MAPHEEALQEVANTLRWPYRGIPDDHRYDASTNTTPSAQIRAQSGVPNGPKWGYTWGLLDPQDPGRYGRSRCELDRGQAYYTIHTSPP